MPDPSLAARRAAAVSAASKSLGRLVEEDPAASEALERTEDLPDAAGYAEDMRRASEDGIAGLRRAKRLALLEIAARDLTGEIELERVGEALADLADGCIGATLASIEADAALTVIAMGKLGGRELNYSSDIDLMFVAAPDDVETATRIGSTLLTELGAVAPEGQAYRIDMNLRPEGRSGALVRSLEGYLEYYRRWAQTWEFQALIKARACGGDAGLGREFIGATRALVFPGQISAEGIENLRRMKERVEEHAQRSARKSRSSEADDVKLGPGGIRDVEFSIQLLQLVHGGTDDSVRSTNTLEALSSLVRGGYVAEDDGAGLSVDLRWLRNVEHRIQLWQERQVHVLPRDPEARNALAHAMGFRDSPSAGAISRFEEAHARVLADVRGRFEKLFYRPMIEALADPASGRLSREALRERLQVLGFRDVEKAARTLDGLVSGTTRRAKLFRVLTPALLRFLSSTPIPDGGLFHFLRLGEVLESRVDILGALRDNPPGLEFLARVLGSGRLLGEVLLHVPEELATIADPRGPSEIKDRDRLVREAKASLGWRDPDRRFDGLRRFKRREMLHVALADLSGTDVSEVGAGLAALADACVEGALADTDLPFAVIGMGKLGGRELNYSSDIDVMFVHEGDPSAAESLAETLLRAIGGVTPEGQAFRMDAALRPEGKSGPLVRTLDSYLEYYKRWSEPWEHMALIKARSCAGDAGLGQRFVEMTRGLAFPREATDAALAQIRHLKARMERERIPKGVDARRHLKLGPGGLSDVEFSVQVIQVLNGARVRALQVPGTLEALSAARSAGLISDEDASRLDETYRFLMRLRNRMFMINGRPADALPSKAEDLEALGVAMGYRQHARQELEEDYLRHTRRARRIAERVIFGPSEG